MNLNDIFVNESRNQYARNFILKETLDKFIVELISHYDRKENDIFFSISLWTPVLKDLFTEELHLFQELIPYLKWHKFVSSYRIIDQSTYHNLITSNGDVLSNSKELTKQYVPPDMDTIIDLLGIGILTGVNSQQERTGPNTIALLIKSVTDNLRTYKRRSIKQTLTPISYPDMSKVKFVNIQELMKKEHQDIKTLKDQTILPNIHILKPERARSFPDPINSKVEETFKVRNLKTLKDSLDKTIKTNQLGEKFLDTLQKLVLMPDKSRDEVYNTALKQKNSVIKQLYTYFANGNTCFHISKLTDYDDDDLFIPKNVFELVVNKLANLNALIWDPESEIYALDEMFGHFVFGFLHSKIKQYENDSKHTKV